MAGFAQKLRSPMQVVMGYAEILADDWASAMRPEPRRIVDRMNESVHGMAETIENILELVLCDEQADLRIEEDFAISDLLCELVVALDGIPGQAGLRIESHGAPDRIRCEYRALRSILLGLLRCALRFAGASLVRLAVRGHNAGGVEFEIGAAAELARELMRQSLEPPAPLATLLERYDSTGIALAAARRRADLLGASLDVGIGRDGDAVVVLRIARKGGTAAVSANI